MNEDTGTRILKLLDVLSVNVAQGHAELRNDIRGLDAKVNDLDAKIGNGFERVERRLGKLESRIENVETEGREFRKEFERRVAPLERRRKS